MPHLPWRRRIKALELRSFGYCADVGIFIVEEVRVDAPGLDNYCAKILTRYRRAKCARQIAKVEP